MNRLSRLVPLLLALGSCLAASPNFIVVIGDDVGWDAFGCTGMETARTPTIDALARQSCKMERFYCSVSQCGPLRAELYTGLLPFNNGVLANASKVHRPGVQNIADHLTPLGYRVGLTGKLHFGLGKARFDKIQGFDSNGNGSGQTHSFNGVRSYIEAAREANENFCVFICSTHAHHPWDHGEEGAFPVETLALRPHYVDSPTTRQAMAKHAAEVEVLDQQVKETLDLMKDMKLSEDTIFIFLSEQGIAMPRGKWSPYEHGSRALCLAHWPGHIAPRSTQAIAMYCDITPTMIDYAGGTIDGLDGRSLKALWSSDSLEQHRDAAFISNVHPFWQKAIVTDRYKLIWTGQPEREHIMSNFTSGSKFFAKPWAEWKNLAKSDNEANTHFQRVLQPAALELYDVVADPYELHNLAADAEQATRVERLHTALKALMTDVGEDIEPPQEKAESPGKKKRRKAK